LQVDQHQHEGYDESVIPANAGMTDSVLGEIQSRLQVAVLLGLLHLPWMDEAQYPLILSEDFL